MIYSTGYFIFLLLYFTLHYISTLPTFQLDIKYKIKLLLMALALLLKLGASCRCCYCCEYRINPTGRAIKRASAQQHNSTRSLHYTRTQKFFHRFISIITNSIPNPRSVHPNRNGRWAHIPSCCQRIHYTPDCIQRDRSSEKEQK